MTTIFNTGSWLSTVWEAGSSTQSTGMMGALQNAGSRKFAPGSIGAFITSQSSIGVTLSSIAQTGVTDATMLAIKQGDIAMQKRFQERMAEAAKHNVPMIPAAPADTVIYFENGSVLDTANNVMTLSTGKKIDTVTGAEWTDPKSIVQMGNGSYLNTQTSILTMPNGTKINTITGLVV